MHTTLLAGGNHYVTLDIAIESIGQPMST